MANHVLMKKCNNCGAEIPRGAAYCDICGARDFIVPEVKSTEERQRKARRKSERKQLRRKIIKKVLAAIGIGYVILVVIALIAGYISDTQFERREKLRDLSGWETVVTKENFEKLEVGMSYDEIVEIVGGPGKKIEEDKYKIRYAWPGEYYVDQRHGLFTVDFYKYNYNEDKDFIPADSIDEDSILDGAEVYETYKLYSEGRYTEIDTPIVKKEQVEKITEGMTYEMVTEILGEGKLYESESWRGYYGTTTYKNYIWRCKYRDRDFYFDLRFEDGVLRYYSDWRVENIE